MQTARFALAGTLLLLLGACTPARDPQRAPSIASPATSAATQPPASAPAAMTSPSAKTAPAAAVRLESALGIQIAVPASWAVNDYGCNMSDRPTMVRGQGAQLGCFTPERPTKELAWIGTDGGMALEALPGFRRENPTLDGTAAERVEGRTSDGRFIGWLRVPSRKLLVVAKVLDVRLLQRILDSAKLVPIDAHGCPEQRPAAKRPAPSPASAAATLAPAAPTSVSVCYYTAYDHRLQASTRLSGGAAVDLAARLNRSAPGPNPDTNPKECLHPPAPPPADAVLFIDDGAWRATVYVAFSGCIGRGLDNGVRQAQVSSSLLKAMLDPLHVGYGFSGDLPP